MRTLWLIILAMLLQATLQPALAQTPACNAVACAQDVSFDNGGVRLSGTLYQPTNRKTESVLIAVHGASGGERSTAIFQHLHQSLPRLGVAVLVFDRRGAGRSTGNLKDADYTALADDAIAARRFLSSEASLRDAPVGYWGYSQGGWIAMIAGSRDPQAAFVISVSAPLVSPDLQMIEATRNILRINGVSDADIALAIQAREAVDAHLRGRVDAHAAQAKLDLAKAKPWFPLIYMSGKLGDPKTSRWLKEISYDPMDALSRVNVPTLLVFGQKDVWIPVQTSVERARALGRKTLDVVSIEGADHAMMESLTPQQQIDPAMSKRYRPESAEYFVALGSWLTSGGFGGLD